MRILFITNRFPGLERRGDQLRAFQQISLLAGRHAITLLSFEHADPHSRACQDMHACCERVIMVKRGRIGQLWRALLALPTRMPLQVAMYDHVPAALDFAAVLQQGQFDLVHVQLARLGPLLGRVAPLPCVLDLVDALSLNMARRASMDRAPMRWLARLEAGRLAQYERALCAQASLSTICAAPDRDAIGDLPRLHLLHNGVDLEEFRIPTVPAVDHEHSLVFVGNLGYFPNVDGVLWFAAQVLPLLLKDFPQLRLRLVGVRPAPALHKLAAQHPNIELVGQVDQVLPWLQQAAVAIAPLRAGSGQQLKILEAMAAGTPVVASAVSAAGLDALDGEHLRIAADAPAMARTISELWTHPRLGQEMAQRARALVESRYSWSSSALLLEQIWLEAAGKV